MLFEIYKIFMKNRIYFDRNSEPPLNPIQYENFQVNTYVSKLLFYLLRSNQRIPAGVNYDAIRNNIQKWSSMGFRGLTVQGSNGSYPYLSTSERVELVEMVREIIDEIQASKIDANDQSDPLLLMAGAGAESTLETQVGFR